MSSLNTKLQELFLFDYFNTPREKLLNDFIDFYVYSYHLDMNTFWSPSAPYDPNYLQAIASGDPTIPPFLVEACEELANLRGVTTLDVVNSLLAASESASKPVTNDIPQEKYQVLLKDYTDLYNGTRIGQWLN